MNMTESMILELVKAGLGLIVLAFFGQHIVSQWSWRLRQRELDRAAASEIYKNFGEFQAVRRLWVMNSEGQMDHILPPSGLPEETRWSLLDRAVAAESGMEAALLRLAVERRLSTKECQELGRARQAYQMLREGIHDREDLHWSRDTPEYGCLKNLTIFVGSVLAKDAVSRPGLGLKERRSVPTVEEVRICQAEIMNRDRGNDWCPGANT